MWTCLPTGEKRRDLLKRMANLLGQNCKRWMRRRRTMPVFALQQMLVRAEANHGIANFWAR